MSAPSMMNAVMRCHSAAGRARISMIPGLAAEPARSRRRSLRVPPSRWRTAPRCALPLGRHPPGRPWSARAWVASGRRVGRRSPATVRSWGNARGARLGWRPRRRRRDGRAAEGPRSVCAWSGRGRNRWPAGGPRCGVGDAWRGGAAGTVRSAERPRCDVGDAWRGGGRNIRSARGPRSRIRDARRGCRIRGRSRNGRAADGPRSISAWSGRGRNRRPAGGPRGRVGDAWRGHSRNDRSAGGSRGRVGAAWLGRGGNGGAAWGGPLGSGGARWRLSGVRTPGRSRGGNGPGFPVGVGEPGRGCSNGRRASGSCARLRKARRRSARHGTGDARDDRGGNGGVADRPRGDRNGGHRRVRGPWGLRDGRARARASTADDRVRHLRDRSRLRGWSCRTARERGRGGGCRGGAGRPRRREAGAPGGGDCRSGGDCRRGRHTRAPGPVASE